MMHRSQSVAVPFVLFTCLFACIVERAEAQTQAVPSGQAKLTLIDPQIGAQLGRSVAIDDDILVAGGLGRVWVFERAAGAPTSSWGSPVQLSAPIPTIHFGHRVAVSRNRIVVSDLGDASRSVNARVFVFERDSNGWTRTATLPDSAGVNPWIEFGDSLAIDGDTIVVGAPSAGLRVGAAHVFGHDGSGWVQEATLFPQTLMRGTGFGRSVAISGRTLCVGAPGATFAQVEIYRRLAGSTTWTIDGLLGETDAPGFAAPGSGFGATLDIDDRTLLVGMPLADAAGENSGAVAVFEDGGGTWSFAQGLVPEAGSIGVRFGSRVDLSRTHAVVGCPTDLSPTGQAVGSVYYFTHTGGANSGSWTRVNRFYPVDGTSGDRFATSVCVDAHPSNASTVVFGSPRGGATADWSGAVYVLDPSPTPFSLATFCFGDGGDQQGCTPCPCGNDAVAGTQGGCLNSNATSARLTAMGTANTSSDTLRLEVVGATPDSFAILVSGDHVLPSGSSGPCASGSGVSSDLLDGLRCIAQNLTRHGAREIDASGSVGVDGAGWGPPSGPVNGLTLQGGFQAGQTRSFQVTYRDDPTLVCASSLNTTNGVTVVVIP